MKKRGFTLAELLGVLVVISLLFLLIIPGIVNRLSESKSDVKESENQMIYDAADQYIREHPNDYPPGKSGRYCIPIQSLIDDGKLIAPVTDITTGEDISNKSVMVTIYSSGNSDYELRDGDKCEELSSLPMIDFIVEPNGSSWVKQRKVTIIYPNVDGNFEASHRIDGKSWVRDNSADKGGNIELVFTEIGQLEARLKSDKIISSKINLINIDSETPVITKVATGTWSNDKNNLQITAQDNISGINGIYISTNNSKPSENASGWISVSSEPKKSKTFSEALDPGTYYIWVKDKAGNISEAKEGKIEETFCPGNICYVSSSGSDSGYGSRKKPFATIQKAFDTVPNNGQVVLLSDIKCNEITQTVPANKNITLKSDGNNKYIIYRNDSYKNEMISQLNQNSSLTIQNLIIDGNFKDAQQPMLRANGKFTIENSILRNARNLNNYGGALYLDEKAEVILRNVEINNNYTTAGGSASNGQGHMKLYNINIHDNEALDGTIWNYGTVEMYSGRIYNNRANYDAGVRNYNRFYMFGGEIDHNVSQDQSGGLKDGCFLFGWGLYVQGTSEVCSGCIHDNSPQDYYIDYNYCDNPDW